VGDDVIPANAGIQPLLVFVAAEHRLRRCRYLESWIPAFAGMTSVECRDDERGVPG
jgi:hypothetical protein